MRTTLSLNGRWTIAESSCDDSPPPPDAFSRHVAVPGLARFAEPPFLGTSIAELGITAPNDRSTRGRKDPRRDYFWYRHTFTLNTLAPVARLRFAKAQFGLRVWLNGQDLGERHACFSSLLFDAGPALALGENTLLVRVGAHPEILPATEPTGSDQEKFLWTAGLYDRVELLLSGAPVIERMQTAPGPPGAELAVECFLHNPSAAPAAGDLHATLADHAPVTLAGPPLAPGERRLLRLSLPTTGLARWSPDSPTLHSLRLATVGDGCESRVGLRAFSFDTATRRALLDGRPLFLRGTNLTLHRFFEDELCRGLPWDEAWARRLLVELPRRYHWNAVRFSIGPVPERWLELADEAGLLIENEFPIWGWDARWDESLVETRVADWMADAQPHASVAWWSLSNETHHPPSVAMVERLRPRDLADRPWNNGYNLPSGPDDPVDDHPYRYHSLLPWNTARDLWSDEDYETATGPKTNNAPHPSAHAAINNEYCWFWLRRDGTPTPLTAGVYARYLLGATSEENRRLYARYLAAETEYFRAHRAFAGVMHFTFLTCDHPFCLTGDLFRDVSLLEVWPEHDEALRHAFSPLGVYLNHWRPRIPQGSRRALDVALVNDHDHPLSGTVALTLHAADGTELARHELPFQLSPLGQHTLRFSDFVFPAALGSFELRATATTEDLSPPTISRRTLALVAP